MNKMKISQIIFLMGLVGLLSAGFLVPTIYAAEDGNFPVFPTVIEGNAGVTVSPSSQTVIEEKNAAQQTKTTKAEPVKSKSIVANEARVFSPWDLVKQFFVNRVKAGEEGVVFALQALDAKPSGQGDLRYQISFANNTNETLRGVSLQVFLPKELQYLDSDVRPDSKTNGIITFDINKVAVGEERVIQLETRLRSQKGIKVATVPATMEYEDIGGGKHTVTAATNSAFNGKSGGLTASVLDGIGGFIMWLFIIILLVALAFVGYQYVTLRASGRRA